jgi:hypothetical protein
MGFIVIQLSLCDAAYVARDERTRAQMRRAGYKRVYIPETALRVWPGLKLPWGDA